MALFEWINKILDGKKSAIGVASAIFTAGVTICNALADGFVMADVQTIGGAIAAIFLAVGLVHKAEKIEAATKK